MDKAAEEKLILADDASAGSERVVGETVASGGDEDERVFIPEVLPVLPVRRIVVFPGTVVPLTVGREKSKRLIDAVFAGNKLLAVCTQRRDEVEDPNIDDVYRIGTACRALKLLRMPDGTNSILVHGIVRIGLEEFVAKEPYWQARVHPREDQVAASIEVEAMAYSARQLAEQVIELSPSAPDEAKTILETIEKPGALADYLSANLSLGLVQKQELLETFDVLDRFRKISAILNQQLEVLKLSEKIQTDVRSQIDKTQREYFLHEQMKAIQKELGEGDSGTAEIEELRKKIAAAKMPETVLKEANREVERLGRLPQVSPERGVIRDYLEWLCEMPWAAETTDVIDIDQAQKVLDEDHYGLEKVKRRILEYLAVLKLNPDSRGAILCFVGPPGVGKTSLGQSISRSMGRKFIRISLGGVRDEADIRGHRRTYIGAFPGRIMQEVRKAGVRNPVMMLDELDKLGMDFRGDPAAALLEVLDPQQNHSFTDHYLGVPFDLSKVLFICTANYMEPVPPALKDRMEVVALPGYTTAEKLQISKRYLVKRQKAENGLANTPVEFSDQALLEIIESYTREAGVRNLERNIGTVLRGIAARVARGENPPAVIMPDMLEDPLGPPRFESETALRTSIPGVATGLAYTPLGGEIIFVEATKMRGRGNFVLTGQLGDVMRESAQAAMAYLRSHARELGINTRELLENDVHIHVPAGGTPKDGPSAGIAMLTALVSLLTGRPVDHSVAMTGEITLRGLVLPIGGVREKVLAGHRAGIKTVILPHRNKRDLIDVAPDVREQIQFVFVEKADEALATAIPRVTRKSPARLAGHGTDGKMTAPPQSPPVPAIADRQRQTARRGAGSPKRAAQGT